MRKRRYTVVAAVVVMLTAFCAISAMGLEQALPDNPIRLHTDSIRTDEISDAQPEENAEGSKTSDKDSKEKGDQKGKAKKDGKDQGETDESTEPEKDETKQDKEGTVEESKKDDTVSERNDGKEGEKGGDVDGMEENHDASDKRGNGKTAEETPIPGSNKEASIVTDLKNQTISVKQLKEDTIKFYAYTVDADENTDLRVKIRNENTSLNGRILKSKGRNYTTKLTLGANYITLYLRKNGEAYYQITYMIDYVSDKADEDSPVIGEHPPTIETNLDGRTKAIKNRNFIFTVSAKTYKDQNLTYDSIRVAFDGKAIRTTPTGSSTYEYDLYFDTPRFGDTEKHKVTVLAWDNEGNSRFKSYTVTYEYAEEGDVIGTATVNIDATTIGLGMIATGAKYEIKQDEPASFAVLAALEEYGFTAGYAGSAKAGFYLKSISGGYIANGARIPQTLKEKIQDDGLNMTGQHSKNKISDFDYTEGSGWMYTIDGTLYPGRGLSNYYLEDGDVLTLRFTLAYGKDLGATSNKGLLSSYCGKWINGSYKPDHHMGKPTIVTEPTCEEAGLEETHCKVKGCREKTSREIKALGHEFKETSRTEATAEREGKIVYTCSRCGKTKTEIIPKKPKPDNPDQPDQPDDPTEPTTEPTTEPITESTEQDDTPEGDE